MVYNVVLDDAVEEMAANESELAIHGSKSSLNKGPAAGIKVRNFHVGMVKICNSNY